MKLIRDLNALQEFAETFLIRFPQGAIVALEGDLGAGKTTFVRAVVAAIAAKHQEPSPRMVSPTFVLHQRYQIKNRSIDHFDLYRLPQVSALESIEIGLQEVLQSHSDGFIFVEWPSKLTPDAGVHFTLRIRFEIQADGSRQLIES